MSAPVDGMTADAREAVSELLQLRGRSITLIPALGTVTEKPGGGKDYAPSTPRAPQIFALFQIISAKSSRAGAKALVFEGTVGASSDGGVARKFVFDMVGAFDAVVEIGDKWEDDLAKYQVESVDYASAYQVGALVTGFLKVSVG